ncbi:MAG: hypothetical protein ACYC6P_07950 [Ignavibacteriaceae bacterium]
MDNLQKYINEALGIELIFSALPKNELNKLPLYLRNNNLKAGEILKRQIIFNTISTETTFTIDQYRKQADIIENTLGKHVVFIFENIEAYNRKRLIQKKVAFILPGKQMYLPFMFIDLKELKQARVKKVEKLFPAAQCLLFYYLLGNDVTGINFKTLAEKLNYGPMTVTRAANALMNLKLCNITGGKDKAILFEKGKLQQWNEAQPFLINPVNKLFFVDHLKNSELIFITDIPALSHYTNIADTGKTSFAMSINAFNALQKEKAIHITGSTEGNITLQIWKYDPGILTNNHYVDPLSLYLTLKDSKDERVEGELKNLLNKLW